MWTVAGVLLLLKIIFWDWKFKMDEEETYKYQENDDEEDLLRFLRGGFGAK